MWEPVPYVNTDLKKLYFPCPLPILIKLCNPWFLIATVNEILQKQSTWVCLGGQQGKGIYSLLVWGSSSKKHAVGSPALRGWLHLKYWFPNPISLRKQFFRMQWNGVRLGFRLWFWAFESGPGISYAIIMGNLFSDNYNNATYSLSLLWRVKETMHIKCLAQSSWSRKTSNNFKF